MTFLKNKISARAAEEILRNTLIDIIPAQIFWKSDKLVYLGCNQTFVASLGLKSKNDIIGKTDFDLPVSKEDSIAYRADDMEVIQSGKAKLNIEERQKLNDGTERILLTSKVPLLDKNKKVFGVLVIYFDITARKKSEEDLRISKEETEASSYIKTEFIVNMGHDLTTPLSDLGGIAEILNSCYPDVDPELKEYFEILVKKYRDCDKIVNSIIDGTSISNLEVKLETFSIYEELLKIEKELAPTIGSKNLTIFIHPFEPKGQGLIETDRTKFSAILTEFVTNAIKFTDEGQITISIAKQDNMFSIQVKDTGIGIPADKFGYIFEQYTKLSRSNKHGADFKGVGAGLFLVKFLAKILAAHISVESEVGKGSIFTLTIPVHHPKNL